MSRVFFLSYAKLRLSEVLHVSVPESSAVINSGIGRQAIRRCNIKTQELHRED